MALSYTIGFKADTSEIKSAISDIESDIKQAFAKSGSVMTETVAEGIQQASVLSEALKKSQTVDGTSYASLNANLKAAGTSAAQMAASLQNAGMTTSLNSLLTQLAAADKQLISVNSKIAEMQRVLSQSIKFNLAMGVQNFFIQNIQSAVSWVQELDTALHDIAVVAPEVAADMEGLSTSIVQSASDLRVAASEYAEAALIFYQQGLSQEDVNARTEYTIMAAKASGTAVEEMSSQLTAIWNTYQMEGEEMGRAASVAAELGAKTAASFSDIAEGMQIAASGASMLGVSYDSLSSIISTVVSKTQQSATTVSTAYKTIFARFSNLSTTGEDAGESLGAITQSLSDMGINVLNASGELKDLDIVIQECGESWDNYTRNQQIAIAQTVGGTRQYQQFLSLMQNYDDYLNNMEIAANVTDTTQLVQQYETAIQTIDTAMINSSEAWSEAFSEVFTSDAQIDFYNNLEAAGEVAHDVITTLGGLEGILTIGAALLATKIVPALYQGGVTIQSWATNLTQTGRLNTIAADAEKMNAAMDELSNKTAITQQGEIDKAQSKIVLIEKEAELQAKNLAEAQKAENQAQETANAIEKQLTKEKEKLEVLKAQAITSEKIVQAIGEKDGYTAAYSSPAAEQYTEAETAIPTQTVKVTKLEQVDVKNATNALAISKQATAEQQKKADILASQLQMQKNGLAAAEAERAEAQFGIEVYRQKQVVTQQAANQISVIDDMIKKCNNDQKAGLVNIREQISLGQQSVLTATDEIAASQKMLQTSEALVASLQKRNDLSDASIADLKIMQSLSQTLMKYNSAMVTSGGDMTKIDMAEENLKVEIDAVLSDESLGDIPTELRTALSEAIASGESVFDPMTAGGANFLSMMDKTIADLGLSDEAAKKLKASFTQTATATDSFSSSQRTLNNAFNTFIDQQKLVVPNSKQMIQQLSSGAAGLTMMVNGVDSLVDSINSGNVSMASLLTTTTQIGSATAMMAKPIATAKDTLAAYTAAMAINTKAKQTDMAVTAALGGLDKTVRLESLELGQLQNIATAAQIDLKGADNVVTAAGILAQEKAIVLGTEELTLTELQNLAEDAKLDLEKETLIYKMKDLTATQLGTTADLESLTVEELQNLAKENNIATTETLNAAELKEVLIKREVTLTNGATTISQGTLTASLRAQTVALKSVILQWIAAHAVMTAGIAIVIAAAAAWIYFSDKALQATAENLRTAADEAKETSTELQELTTSIEANTEALRENVASWKDAIASGEDASSFYEDTRLSINELNSELSQTGVILDGIDLGELGTLALQTGDFTEYFAAVEAAQTQFNQLKLDAINTTTATELAALKAQYISDNNMVGSDSTARISAASSLKSTPMTVADANGEIERVELNDEVKEIFSQTDLFSDYADDAFGYGETINLDLNWDDSGELRTQIEELMATKTLFEQTFSGDELANDTTYQAITELLSTVEDSYNSLEESAASAIETISAGLAYDVGEIEVSGYDFESDLAALEELEAVIYSYGVQAGLTAEEIDTMTRSIVAQNEELNRTLSLQDMNNNIFTRLQTTGAIDLSDQSEALTKAGNDYTNDIAAAKANDISYSGLSSRNVALDAPVLTAIEAEVSQESLTSLQELRAEYVDIQAAAEQAAGTGIGDWRNDLTVAEEAAKEYAAEIEALDAAISYQESVIAATEAIETEYDLITEKISNLTTADQDILLKIGIDNIQELDDVTAKIEAYKSVEMSITVSTYTDRLGTIEEENEFQDSLQDIMDEYSSDGVIGYDSAKALIDAGYTDYLISTEEGFKLTTEAIKDFNTSIENERDLLVSLVEDGRNAGEVLEDLAYAAADIAAVVRDDNLKEYASGISEAAIAAVNCEGSVEDTIAAIEGLQTAFSDMNDFSFKGLDTSDLEQFNALIIESSEGLAQISQTLTSMFESNEISSGDFIRQQGEVAEAAVAQSEAYIDAAKGKTQELAQEIGALGETYNNIDNDTTLGTEEEKEAAKISIETEINEKWEEIDEITSDMNDLEKSINEVDEALSNIEGAAAIADSITESHDALDKFLNDDFSLDLNVEMDDAAAEEFKTTVNEVMQGMGDEGLITMQDVFNITDAGVVNEAMDSISWETALKKSESMSEAINAHLSGIAGESVVVFSEANDGIINGLSGSLAIFNGYTEQEYANVMNALSATTAEEVDAMNLSTQEAALMMAMGATSSGEIIAQIGTSVGQLFEGLGELVSNFDYDLTIGVTGGLDFTMSSGEGDSLAGAIKKFVQGESAQLPTISVTPSGSIGIDIQGDAGTDTASAISKITSAGADIGTAISALGVMESTSSSTGTGTPSLDNYNDSDLSEGDPTSILDSDGGTTSDDSDSSSDDDAPEAAERAESTVERYTDINTAIETVSSSLDKLDTIEENATGSAKLKALEAKTKAIQKQAAEYTKLIEEAQNYYSVDDGGAGASFGVDSNGIEITLDGIMGDADRLQQKLDNIGMGVDQQIITTTLTAEFDETGSVTNAEEILDTLYAQADAYFDSHTYQYFDSDSEEYSIVFNTTADEDAYNAIISQIESINEQIETVEETAAQIADAIQTNLELLFEWIQTKIDAIEYKVELRIELNDLDIAIVESTLSQLGSEQYTTKISLTTENFNSAKDTAEALVEKYNEVAAVLEDLNDPSNQAYFINKYGQDAWDEYLETGDMPDIVKESLADSVDDLLSQLEELYDYNDEVWAAWGDAIDTVADKFDTLITKYDNYSDMMDSLQTIWAIAGTPYEDATVAIDLMNKSLTIQETKVTSLQDQYETNLAMLEMQQTLYEAAVESNGADSQIAQDYADKLVELEQTVLDSKTELFAEVASYLEALEEASEASAEVIVNAFTEALDGLFADLESASEMLSQYTSIEDYYVTDTTAASSIYSMVEELQGLMASTTDPSQYAAYAEYEAYLNSMLEEKTVMLEIAGEMQEVTVQTLKDGVELTATELEIMEAEFELAKTQAAWEEAQNNKDTMRLARDASGNYSYIYSANESEDTTASDINAQLANIMALHEQAADEAGEMWLETLTEYREYIAEIDQERYNQDVAYKEEVDQRCAWYTAQMDLYSDSIESHNAAIDRSFEDTALGVILNSDDMQASNDEYKANTAEMTEALKDNYDDYLDKTEVVLDAVGCEYEDLQAWIEEESEEIMYQNDETADSVEQMKDDSIEYLEEIEDATLQWASTWVDACDEVIDSINETIAAYRNMLDVMNSEVNADYTYDASTDYTAVQNDMIASGYVNASDWDDSMESMYAKIRAAYDDDYEWTGTDAELQKVLNSGYDFSVGDSYSDFLKNNGLLSGSQIADAINDSDDLMTQIQNATDVEEAKTDIAARWRKIKALVSTGAITENTSWASDEYDWYTSGDSQGFYNGMVKEVIDDEVRAGLEGVTVAYASGGLATEPQIATVAEEGKELILNPVDTENMLLAIQIMRDSVAQYLSGLGTTQGNTISTITGDTNNTTTSQVVINAEFPNVSARDEIEAAFANIINEAAQYQI